MNRYVTGDTVTLGNTFTVNGTATDPTAVTLVVTDPAGTATTYNYPTPATITRTATGVYTKNVVADSAGIWRFVWTGTGTAADVQDSSFTVVTPSDVRLLVTPDLLKNELGLTDTTDDLAVEISCEAASADVEAHCGQRFWQDTSVQVRTFYPPDAKCLAVLDQGNAAISTTTGLIVKLDTDDTGTYETTLTVNTDFVLLPQNAALEYPVQPYTEVLLTGATYWFNASQYQRPTVQITAKWGWPAVPPAVRKAALIQARELFKAKDSAFGFVAFGGESPTARTVNPLHPLARGLISKHPYAKPAVG